MRFVLRRPRRSPLRNPARVLDGAPPAFSHPSRDKAGFVDAALERILQAAVFATRPDHYLDCIASAASLASPTRRLESARSRIALPATSAAQRMAESLTRKALTAREGEVLRLFARGQCNKAIARDLEIAVGTVKAHIKAIMGKLDGSSRTEAASIASQRGLVDGPGVDPIWRPPFPAAYAGRACLRTEHHA